MMKAEAGAQAEEAERSAVAAAAGSFGAKVEALIAQLLSNRQSIASPSSGAAGRGSNLASSPHTQGGASVKSVVFSQFLGGSYM